MTTQRTKLIWSLAIAAALHPLSAAAPGQERAGKAASASDLAWMSGTWVREQGDRRSEEVWTVPAGGTLIGLARSVSGERTTNFEYLRIETRGGNLVYLASPGGRCPATPFVMIESGERRVVFENKENDFPQRVIYWSEDDDVMSARIEGESGAAPRSMEWSWSRAKG